MSLFLGVDHGGEMLRLSVAILIVGSLLPSAPWRWACAGVLLVVAVIAAQRREIGAAVIAGLGVVVVGTASRFAPSIWIAASVAGVAWWRLPRLRPHLGPVRRGSADRTSTIVGVATVLAAAVGLAIWAASMGDTSFDADESSIGRLADQIEAIPLWVFPLAALAFAVVNALAEEFVYRGVLLHALLPLGAPIAVLVQAAAFGAVHLNGFPSGWLGVAMATVYGVALGWLRIRTDGLLIPVAVHLTADVVVAFLVRFLV